MGLAQNEPVFVTEDDPQIAKIIVDALTGQGYSVTLARSVTEACRLLDEQPPPQLALLDVQLPDGDGLTILKEIKQRSPAVCVIMMSAHASIQLAIQCIKSDAYDFIEKPFKLHQLFSKVSDGLRQHALARKVSSFDKELGETYKFKTMISDSTAMKKNMLALEVVSQKNINVLITGESGTGKELTARAIHHNSLRKEGPFIAVNCMAIPEQLLESELFGYEKGAFTGAQARRIGKFEQAQTGTIFLDEIGDLSADLQGKLLRVIQEREVERVGGSEPIVLDVRFIFATNKDLSQLVRQGKFREDLFFRINVFPIRLPPLRERSEDIETLLAYFVCQFSDSEKGTVPRVEIEPAALEKLKSYGWPGNIRELENFVERLMAIKPETACIRVTEKDTRVLESSSSESADAGIWMQSNVQSMEEAEKVMLERALKQAEGNLSKAAKILKISRQTIYRKMEKYLLTKDTASKPSSEPLAKTTP